MFIVPYWLTVSPYILLNWSGNIWEWIHFHFNKYHNEIKHLLHPIELPIMTWRYYVIVMTLRHHCFIHECWMRNPVNCTDQKKKNSHVSGKKYNEFCRSAFRHVTQFFYGFLAPSWFDPFTDCKSTWISNKSKKWKQLKQTIKKKQKMENWIDFFLQIMHTNRLVKFSTWWILT